MSNHDSNATTATTTPPPDSGDGADAALSVIGDWFDAHPTWGRLVASALVLLVAWILIKITERALVRSTQRMGRHRGWDDYETRVAVGRTKPLRMTVKVTAFVFAFIGILGVWGLSTAFTGLLAGAGFAGIVIGLAAGDTLGDMIAGFMIFYNHPFDIGDWVEIDGVQGIVDDVRLGATTLLTFDNEKVTIPNRIVEGQKVKNFSHARKLRFKMPVGVEYGSDVKKARRILEEVGAAHAQVLKEPPPLGVVMGFGPSSVDMELRVWVEPVRNSVLKVRDELLETIHTRFRDEGIAIAFPHMQIVQPKPWTLEQA